MPDSQTTPEREALEALWPFVVDEEGSMITEAYCRACVKAGDALGKEFFAENRGNGMYYIKVAKP